MKRLFIATVSALLLSGFVTPVAKAQDVRGVSPFDLVYLAYQGYLEDEGIPSYGRFRNEVHLRNIDADDLIEAGIRANRVSVEARDSDRYEQAVQLQLRGLIFGDNGN